MSFYLSKDSSAGKVCPMTFTFIRHANAVSEGSERLNHAGHNSVFH